MTSKKPVKSARSSGLKIFHRDPIQVTVRLLEKANTHKIVVPATVNGKWLLEQICRIQEITDEIEYFGLRYISCEILSSPTKHWMDLARNVHSQLRHTNPPTVSFRMKHYPSDPLNEFLQDKSKYLLFYQLYQDFLGGRIIASREIVNRVAALFVQVILGDACELEPQPPANTYSSDAITYLSNVKAVYNQSKRDEREIIEEHRKLEGFLPSEAASEVIRIIIGLESYGIEPTKVQAKHKLSGLVHVGLTHEGVAEFFEGKRVHLFRWRKIDRMFYNGRHFILIINKSVNKGQKPACINIDYKCETKSIASELWKWALERKMFFTLERAARAKPIKARYNLFSRNHTFHFLGRSQNEILKSQLSLSSTLPNLHRLQATPKVDSSLNGHNTSLHVDVLLATQSEPMILSMADTPALRHSHRVVGESLERCDERSASLEISESENAKTSLPMPTFIALAPYFDAIPNRKYGSLSRIRQQRSLTLAKEGSGSEYNLNGDISGSLDAALITFDNEHNLAAIAEQESNQVLADASIESSPRQFFMQTLFSATPIRMPAANHNCVAKTKAVDDSVAEVDGTSPETEVISRSLRAVWQTIVIPGGTIAFLTLLSAVIVTEFDIHAPLINTVRGTQLFVYWERLFYAPVRTSILRMFNS